MSFPRGYEENNSFSEYSYEEDTENLDHKKRVRKLLEERLERKRLREELKEEFDDLDDRFDWDDDVNR
ncbi:MULTISPECIES: hypothetical protein [unclassified Legionella]|uniref:hypothetical protein n=1 Tax=unclassified Legionella TaxID=2622702 RepID=UPI0010561738|nr:MULTISPECIES: hypothetical protein [unclassified Legionella]MDI9818270.1 hypothetical protein [Legionella sp. PL877]